jgi:hypothetical protein
MSRPTMALESGIAKRFKKAFVLDEDGLRRLEGVLTKAITTYPEPLTITFRVEREDDRFFETHSIDEVLADPNIDNRSIRLLALELRAEWLAVAEIRFDKDRPPFQEPDVKFHISCPDKTWALMLADEIEPQLTRLFKAKPFPKWIFFLFTPLIGLAAYRLSTYLGMGSLSSSSDAIIVMFCFLVLLLSLNTANALASRKLWLFKLITAEPVFLWGEQLTTFNDRESLRKNLFWSVLVGFFVSLIAGFATLLV